MSVEIDNAIKECTEHGSEYVDLYPGDADTWADWRVEAFMRGTRVNQWSPDGPHEHHGPGWQIKIHHYDKTPTE